MKDELIEFGTAKLAKEKGFNITVDNAYWKNIENNYYLNHDPDYFTSEVLEHGDNYAAPTQTLLQRWLREKHNLSIDIISMWEGDYGFNICTLINGRHYTTLKRNNLGRYEEALEVSLQEALKLIE